MTHTNIYHISDTHGNHRQLSATIDALSFNDIMIHSGDATNSRDPYRNEYEMRLFIEWFGKIDNIKHKIFVPGNHDTSIEKGLITKTDFESAGITLLVNDHCYVDGIKIWGSPMTPTFGNWSYMTSRAKIHRYWDSIPDDVDVVVTHGPPIGVLDLTIGANNNYKLCGCKSLMSKMASLEPKLHCFGHVHDYRHTVVNAGTKKLSGLDTIFSNGSCVTDGIYNKLSAFGNMIELTTP